MSGQGDPELRQVTERLRSCEEHFDAVFNVSAVGMGQLTLDGRWLLANQKLCDILGYGQEQLRALTIQELCHPDDLPAYLEKARRLASHEIASFTKEKRFVRRDGAMIWVNLYLTTVRNTVGFADYFVAVVEDISERKLAEEELRQSRERLKKIFQVAPVGMTISTLTDGTFVDINEAGERLSGFSRDEVIGRRAGEFHIWKSSDVRATILQEVLEKGEVRDREMLFTDRSGRSFWGSYSAVVVEIQGEKHLLSLVTDIDERKKAEEALRESEERFRLVADNAPVMIWAAGRDAGCTFVNRTWLEYTGTTLEQELGYGWTESIHAEDRQNSLQVYLSALKERRPFTLEYRLRRQDGAYGWIVDTGVPHISPDGELVGYVGTAVDVTEQKQTKERLEQDKEELSGRVAERTAELTRTIESLQGEIGERIRVEQALQEEISERLNVQAELREKELLLMHQSRLAAMGEMIGNIAHQWRQPLNHLGLVAQELAITYRKGDFSAEYLDDAVKKILEMIRHMSQTIDDFRNFFRPLKEKVDFAVAEVIGKTLSLLDGSLKALQIRTELSGRCEVRVNGYPNEFSQVLLNIIINARDAFAERSVPDPTIWIESAREGDGCVVTITDNAGGIPEEIMEKIFDPYFTTKGPEKGTGVGLFMSRTIIEKNMGGTLTVRNVPGGAEFRIKI